MNTLYRSPWARQYNPLRRRQGESYKRHEDRVTRYCVIVIALIALGLITWTTRAVPDTTPHTSHAEVTRRAQKVEMSLSE